MSEFGRRKEKSPGFEDIPVIIGRQHEPVEVRTQVTAQVESHTLIHADGSLEARLQAGSDKIYTRSLEPIDPMIENARHRAEQAEKPKVITTHTPEVKPLPEKPVAQRDVSSSIDGEKVYLSDGKTGDHQAWLHADKKTKDKVIRGR